MLPFVVKMNPVEAFAFLLGMAAVTNTTGDITSVLFGIPGEPTTASTIVDGHPMAKHGEAGRALGAAIMSSLFGAVFGALVLGLAIPVVRPLVLTFGSPEFFMLALLGITFVAALSGEAILTGLVASLPRTLVRHHRARPGVGDPALHVRSALSLGRHRARARDDRVLRDPRGDRPRGPRLEHRHHPGRPARRRMAGRA
jgi:hypothetical protein